MSGGWFIACFGEKTFEGDACPLSKSRPWRVSLKYLAERCYESVFQPVVSRSLIALP